MFLSNDSVVVVDLNVPAAHVALHHWQPNTPDGQGTPFLFNHGRNAASSTSGAFMRMFKGSTSSGEDNEFPRAIAFAASAICSSAIVAVTCDKDIITGDYFSHYFPLRFIINTIYLLDTFSNTIITTSQIQTHLQKMQKKWHPED
jgi:hypothetical protein